jgi:hypothetical protein
MTSYRGVCLTQHRQKPAREIPAGLQHQFMMCTKRSHSHNGIVVSRSGWHRDSLRLGSV